MTPQTRFILIIAKAFIRPRRGLSICASIISFSGGCPTECDDMDLRIDSRGLEKNRWSVKCKAGESEMELKGTSIVGRTLEESGVPRCVSPFDHLGPVFIVSFVEETEGLLSFSSKYLGCRIRHFNKRVKIVVNDLHYPRTRIVQPSQSGHCPPKIHIHVPVQPG